MIQNIKALWLSRHSRERGLLLLCVGLALIALLWPGVQASVRYQLSAQQQARTALAGLAAMENQIAALEPLLMRQKRQHSPRWQEEVLALAKEKGLVLALSGRDSSQLLFSPTQTDVPLLIEWLLQLEQEYHVHASRLLLNNKAQGPELVQLVLQRDE